jgi:hypothetical protein
MAAKFKHDFEMHASAGKFSQFLLYITERVNQVSHVVLTRVVASVEPRFSTGCAAIRDALVAPNWNRQRGSAFSAFVLNSEYVRRADKDSVLGCHFPPRCLRDFRDLRTISSLDSCSAVCFNILRTSAGNSLFKTCSVVKSWAFLRLGMMEFSI